MKNLLLLLIAISLLFLVPLSIIYTAITRGIFGLRDTARGLAEALDRLGGVVCKDMFNDLMVKPNGHKFGNGEEYISYVLGINKLKKTLYKIGIFVANLLNKCDKDHVENAVKAKDSEHLFI